MQSLDRWGFFTSFCALQSVALEKERQPGSKDEGMTEPDPESGAVEFEPNRDHVTGKVIHLLL